MRHGITFGMRGHIVAAEIARRSVENGDHHVPRRPRPWLMIREKAACRNQTDRWMSTEAVAKPGLI